ncbi:hypothetical protein BDQ17DRAFT_1344092 [Cyathus striatus]|nr:hypothetical protein BDQ17DRAFT_1344092 [Cyathus striatus]
MQSKVLVTLLFACMTVLVSASPVPVTPPLDVEAREPVQPNLAREPEALPEPGCQRYGCF